MNNKSGSSSPSWALRPIYNGLQEAKYCITELITGISGTVLPREEQGRYLEEIFDAIDWASKMLDESDNYKLVLWPESQTYMEEPWFEEEAVLADCEQLGESQAYFIPIDKVKPHGD